MVILTPPLDMNQTQALAPYLYCFDARTRGAIGAFYPIQRMVAMPEGLEMDSMEIISREYIGHISGKPRHVVRFCGNRLADFGNAAAAIMFAAGESCRRRGALIVSEVKA